MAARDSNLAIFAAIVKQARYVPQGDAEITSVEECQP
jgi:hypothetical protein